MGKFIDLTGQKFGRLTILSRAENDKYGNARWNCLCDCGCSKTVLGAALRIGSILSCGCLHRERVRRKKKILNNRLYNIYYNMKSRCYNPNAKHFDYYGGRGIKICDEWLDKENGFTNFYNWAMANGYNDTLTIDRIDNDKGYNEDNCRWVTRQEQVDNRRSSKSVIYEGGKYKSFSEASRILNVPITTIIRKYKKQENISKHE